MVKKGFVAAAATIGIFALSGMAHAAPPYYAPDNLQVTAVSPTEIDLSWTPVVVDPPVTGYMIQREFPVGGGFTTIVANTGSAGTTYADNGLTPGVTYSYRVAAINADGVGGHVPQSPIRDDAPPYWFHRSA